MTKLTIFFDGFTHELFVSLDNVFFGSKFFCTFKSKYESLALTFFSSMDLSFDLMKLCFEGPFFISQTVISLFTVRLTYFLLSLQMFYYGSNFPIFLLTNQHFRKEFKTILHELRKLFSKTLKLNRIEPIANIRHSTTLDVSKF
jgi:hypothetical protein